MRFLPLASRSRTRPRRAGQWNPCRREIDRLYERIRRRRIELIQGHVRRCEIDAGVVFASTGIANAVAIGIHRTARSDGPVISAQNIDICNAPLLGATRRVVECTVRRTELGNVSAAVPLVPLICAFSAAAAEVIADLLVLAPPVKLMTVFLRSK